MHPPLITGIIHFFPDGAVVFPVVFAAGAVVGAGAAVGAGVGASVGVVPGGARLTGSSAEGEPRFFGAAAGIAALALSAGAGDAAACSAKSPLSESPIEDKGRLMIAAGSKLSAAAAGGFNAVAGFGAAPITHNASKHIHNNTDNDTDTNDAIAARRRAEQHQQR